MTSRGWGRANLWCAHKEERDISVNSTSDCLKRHYAMWFNQKAFILKFPGLIAQYSELKGVLRLLQTSFILQIGKLVYRALCDLLKIIWTVFGTNPQCWHWCYTTPCSISGTVRRWHKHPLYFRALTQVWGPIYRSV